MFELLIVDDDREILEMLAVALHRPEVRLLTASRYDEALEMIERFRPPVAVFDVHLSQSCSHEGLELLRQLRLHNAAARGVVITGWSSPKLLARAYRLGAAYFMRKPLDLHELDYQLRLLGLPSATPRPSKPVVNRGALWCAWAATR